MKTTLLLLGGFALTNLLWFGAYRLEDNAVRAAIQLPDTSVYQIRKTDSGELNVYCLNGGDPTIRPVNEFGNIIVSCGK
jgi:hypothetical protein